MTIAEDDLRRLAEGTHDELWRVLGAHVRPDGTSFAVWAPRAVEARVVGDFNGWLGGEHAMRGAGGGSGVWELFVPGVGEGASYKFELVTPGGTLLLKADPYAFLADVWTTNSVVTSSSYRWEDESWLERRRSHDALRMPMSIYEVHLGSWRTLTYRELATELVDYVADMGFTHVELLPVMEHPYGPSWGYQVTGYFAPTARYGPPDDLRLLVDAFHARDIGVILDWAPAHFPKDGWALARFDGAPLYEPEDVRREHPDWGTLVFDLGRPEVRNFLRASALYWIEEYHADGLRVDAVASMLYLDYSRSAGQWTPNVHGGREDLDTISFLQDLNTVVHGRNPGVLTVAEESTAWPGVSRPVEAGGLGFSHKWNMGWMHDTLGYLGREPVHRRWHHHELTFGLTYAWSENFVLPLSHDEVVHEKGTLLTRMPGDRWQQMANVRALLAWMWAHPGKQLLFMGGELAQEREWSSDRSLDWHVLEEWGHGGVQALVRELNRCSAAEPALWSGDVDPEGFRWIDPDDAEQSCCSFLRLPVGVDGRPVACLANFTPVPRYGYRVGLPTGGGWQVLVNSDASTFAGSGVPVGPVLEAEPLAWHGFDHSAVLTLPPLAVVWLAPER